MGFLLYKVWVPVGVGVGGACRFATKAMFVLGVIINWKMFYTIDGVWQLKKLKSNWKYISLTVKYPTYTRKIFYTIILSSNHFHSSEN